MRDILYEMKKQEQIDEEVDPKTILPKEFYKYLNIFLKATINTLPSYKPLDYYITLKGDVKLSYSPLYNML